ncbi:MAG: cytochrome c3 family protein [Magnetovibrio sp.]|nr:cytochrome c3 family protein [Magnetovibrio sp.]
MSKRAVSTSFKKTASMAVVVSALALGGSIAQAGTIVGSLHDMSASGTGQGTTTETEVCVFCHTPHGSDTAAKAPLWNKKLPSAATFTLYSTLGTATLDGDEAAVGSVSLACLSCHDGSQAMDAVLNAPGSGGYNAAGAKFAGVGITAMTGSPIPMLGTDLTNDHPIGIVYGAYTGGTDTASYTAESTATINGNAQYWVNGKGSTVAGREKTDMILFTRADGKPRVECASCHDPHNGPDAGVTNVFLRINNKDSDVCLSCHVK